MNSQSKLQFIDTHCHLDFPEYDLDREEVVLRAKEHNVDYIINVGSDVSNSKRAVAVAQKFENVFATVGCHPHDASSFSSDMIDVLKDLAGKNKVLAIGEIGLDYYRNLSPAEFQKKVFVDLIHLAKEKNLPIVLHSRHAESDTLEILKAEKVEKAIVHCFSSNENFLKDCLDLGYYVSFTCNVTYKKSQALRDILKIVPLDRFCLETDAPYLSPEGYRGKRNEPWFVALLAQEVAKIRGCSLEEVANATTANAKKFFGII